MYTDEAAVSTAEIFKLLLVSRLLPRSLRTLHIHGRPNPRKALRRPSLPFSSLCIQMKTQFNHTRSQGLSDIIFCVSTKWEDQRAEMEAKS